MNNWTRRISVALLVLLLAICFLVFAACKGNVPDVHNNQRPTTKQVSVAMTEVYNAIKASNHSQGVTDFTLTFNGTYSGEKSLTYSFAANFDISATNLNNDTASELSFIIAEETGNILELFYKGGYLYIDYPPIINKGKLSGFNLAQIAESFYDANKPDGRIEALADLIPVIGNYIFSDCMFSRENNISLYNFTISFEAFFNSLATIMQLADIGIGREELLAVLGLSVADVIALQTNGTGNVKITTVTSGGVAVFDKAEYSSSYTVDNVIERSGFSIKDFVLKNGTSLVAMPTNLASAYSYYSFANLDLEGSITIDTFASDTYTELGVSEILRTRLSAGQYVYYYTLKSNYTASGEATFLFSLTTPEEKTIKLYYAESVLYMDLTDVGMGKLLTSADWIKDILTGFDLMTDGASLTTNQKIAIFAELLARSVKTNNGQSYSLGKNSIKLLLDSVGYDSMLEYDDITLSFNTTNNRLQSASLIVEALGARVTVIATSPKIGAAVSISKPSWTTGCVDLTITERFTPVVSGTVRSSTLAADDLTLLEKFVESLTGESVSFTAASRNNIKYQAQANINSSGALTALKVDFRSSTNAYICSFYFTNETDNKFYIIYPLQNGVNPVTTHTIKNTERYSLFVQAINGNALVEYASPLFSLTNSDGNWAIGANRLAINNLLSSVTKVFAGNTFPIIPSDFAITEIDAKFVNGVMENKVSFADNKSITFTVEDFSLQFHDVGISSIAVNNRSVSIYQNNNMESSTTVTFGDGSTAVFSLRDAAGASRWTYSSIPTVGSGVVNVTANVSLLGRVFSKNIQVNTSAHLSADILEVTSQYYNKPQKKFSFPRYNCNDNPIDIITAFNRVAINTSVINITNKEVRWLWNGTDIRTGGLNTASASTFNIIPVVSSFFGTNITLYPSGTYTVEVNGEAASGIVNSGNYLTITAYDGNDPYSESTYEGAMVELAGGGTLLVTALRWDISSIKAGTINNIHYLKNSLYQAEGTYRINAVVADCMGREVVYEVTVNVVPRKITQAVFATYAPGVSFEGRTVGEDGIIGKFTFNPMIITSLSSAAVYANTAICNQGQFTLSSLKWEITPVASIDIFAGREGEFSLVVGNEVGGYQVFRVLYEFPPVNVEQVALADGGGKVIQYNNEEQIVDVTSSIVSFSLLGLDPYEYSYPEKVIFYYEGGEHVFDVNWAFGWDENRLWNRGVEYKYISSFTKTSLRVNLEMSFEPKIVEAFKFVENPTNNDVVVFSKIVGGSPVEVTLDYKVLDGQKRFVFASYGAFDPTKAFDYSDVDNYPKTVYIKFLGEDDWRMLDIEWDISAYDSRTDILQNGYSGKIIARLPLSQSIGDVYVSIAASYPDEVFVIYEDDGEVTDKKVRFSILSVDGSTIIITDPRAVDNFPTSLYLSYAPSKNLDSGWFEISEWVLTGADGLNKIDKYYRNMLAANTPLQNISNASIVVNAKFGNAKAGYITIPVEVVIEASVMTDEVLGGMPLANSSITGGGGSQNSMVYSVVDGIPSLTVDPYIANPRSSASYPTELTFTLNSEHTISMTIASWDLSNVPANNLHLGTNNGNYYLVNALINVGMDISYIKLPVRLYIIPRVIEKVWVDGSVAKNIYIDPYSLQPFGQNVEGNYAYKRVVAKFAQDDNTYTMVMRYDISGVTLSYTGGAAAYNVAVHVGNEAGGYQQITGYNIYIRQSLIVNISTAAEVDDEPIGLLYEVTNEGGTLVKSFKDLTSEELSAMLAHKVLTISFGAPGEITAVREISEYDGILEGLVCQWKRDEEGVLYLELWNNNPMYLGLLGDNQIIVSGLTNYVVIDHNLFTLPLPEDEYEEVYSGKTAGAFLAEHPIASDVFTEEQMSLKLIRAADDYVMQSGDVLNAGAYHYVITVTGHCEYGGSITRTIYILQKAVLASNFNITIDGLVVGLNPAPRLYDGNEVILSANVAGIPELTLSIVYSGFSGNPKNVGTYNYGVISDNPNYISTHTGSITINPIVINETNSIISVGNTDMLSPPAVTVIVDGMLLTTSNYSLYYGSESNPESITIANYATFTTGFNFGGADSKEAYVKIVINLDNYVVTTIVKEFILSKAQA